MEEVEPKLYTLFSYYHSNFVHGAEERDGTITILPWMNTPNTPRLSLDGNQGIVTGIFEFSGATHLTQQEAETLMQTPEWNPPQQEGAPHAAH
ncbi:hypothetical protein [Endozoicomonas sp. ALD040]|uniref:hypothetical protein n=1 Tax=Endozoicomonas sp. ALD040 TaxID=3403079 RepID=UPI003BAFEE25